MTSGEAQGQDVLPWETVAVEKAAGLVMAAEVL